MIALWDQQAKQSGLPRPGFVPPLLYSIAKNAQVVNELHHSPKVRRPSQSVRAPWVFESALRG
jgi:hypothetical protein